MIEVTLEDVVVRVLAGWDDEEAPRILVLLPGVVQSQPTDRPGHSAVRTAARKCFPSRADMARAIVRGLVFAEPEFPTPQRLRVFMSKRGVKLTLACCPIDCFSECRVHAKHNHGGVRSVIQDRVFCSLKMQKER